MAPLKEIRRATADEAAALEALQRRASDIHPEYRDDLAAHPEAISVAVADILGGGVRVATMGGRLVGFSAVLPVVDGNCELDGLFVEPDAMGQGIGRLLVEDVVLQARAAGADRIEVTANPNAYGFYERVGFVLGEVAQTRFGPARRMRLSLDE